VVSVTPSVFGDDTNFTVTASTIDLNTIFLKNDDSPNLPNTQQIDTNVIINHSLDTSGNSIVRGNMVIYGNTFFSGNVYSSSYSYLNNVVVNKNVNNISNTSLDVSGNVIVTKLGIGTSSVNSEYSLEVKGNVYNVSGGFIQGTNGFIWQF
jgi:hypothetical protein